MSPDAPTPDDPVQEMRARGKSPEVAALLAWLVPGSGHLYAGAWVKGVGGLVFVLGMFVAGLALSRGDAVSLKPDVGHEYAFLAQVGVGLPTALGLAYSYGHLPLFGHPPDLEDPDLLATAAYADRLHDADTGLLFTMVAGLLNLLLIHDALNGVPGALSRRQEEAQHRERIEVLRAEMLREARGEKEGAA